MHRVAWPVVVAVSMLCACGPAVTEEDAAAIDATDTQSLVETGASEGRSAAATTSGERPTTSAVTDGVVPDGLPAPVGNIDGQLAIFLRPLLPHEEDVVLDEELSIAQEKKSEPLDPAYPPSYYLDAFLRHLRVGANLQSGERRSLLETAVGYTDTAANAQRIVNGTHGVVACTDFGDDDRIVTETAADFARTEELDSVVVIRVESRQAEYQWVLASVDNMLFSWESSTPIPLDGPSTLDADIERLMALTLDDLDDWRALEAQCTDESQNGVTIEDCAGIEAWIATTTA